MAWNTDNYKLYFKTRAGVKVAEVTDFLWLSASKGVLQTGIMRFGLPSDHAALSLLENRGQIELWRRDPEHNLAWYQWWGGFYLGEDYAQEEEGVVEISASHYSWLLGTRVVAYPANTSNRSAFRNVPAETIGKTVLRYNFTADATIANGRIRDGDGIPHTVTYATDQARGTSIDTFCMGQNVLEVLRDVSIKGGGDFDLSRTDTNEFTLEFYPGQLGTDRTATVIFSIDRGNLSISRYRQDRTNAATVAIVGGEGEEDNREFAVRTGLDYSDPDNDIEVFVNASNEQTSGSTEEAGDRKLEETRAVKEFEFEILQTYATALDVHYSVGDLVTVVNHFKSESMPQKVNFATITLPENGEETIDIDTVNV